METKLKRIAEVAKANPNEKFTSLAHLINSEMLTQCHKEMKGKKAAGVDSVTKQEYEEHLNENLDELVARLKRHAYKPQPVRRVYIPKEGTDKKRPLGIPAYEDKLVQSALAKVMNAIYEQDFLECSFGFRPERGAHDALKVLNRIVNMEDINYIVDTDIKGFFDNVSHEWLMKFVAHRIADTNIQRLIVRFLKSGIMEAGIKYDTHSGTPQGGVCSPILGNLYLHYSLDIWFEKIVRKRSRGAAYMVRYADDSVFCFQYEEDARVFYKELVTRLAKFNLEIAEDKTKIIRLNKGNNDSDKDGNSFDFLGFTHYVDKDKYVKVKTSKKKFRASLIKCKIWIRENRTLPVKVFMDKIRIKMKGHINYFGVTHNRRMISNFVFEVRKLIFKWLNRRSQRRSFDWIDYAKFLLKYPLPPRHTNVKLYVPGAGESYVL